MSQPALITSEKRTNFPVLVVDKAGIIGEALTKELKNEALVVFVSKKAPEVLDNIVHVPFNRNIPSIPDNTYSHIFVVDEKIELAKELIQEFIKKAAIDNSPLNLIVGLGPATKRFMNNYVNTYDKTKIIVFGDIFKKDSFYDQSTVINKYILQAKNKGRILISGDGTKKTYPVYFDDLIKGILEAGFGVDEKNNIIYLFPEHGITLLSLANIFRKKDPDLKIDFIKEKSSKDEDFLPTIDGFYLLGEGYKLEERIKKVEIMVAPINEEKEPEARVDGENTYTFKVLFLLLAFLILLPLISTLLFSFIGVSSLYLLKNNLEKDNLVFSESIASFASGSFALAQQSSVILSEEAKLTSQEQRLNGLINSLNSGTNISVAALSLIDASDKLKKVVTTGTNNPSADFSSATVEIKNALYLYNQEKQKKTIPESITQKLDDSIKIISSTIDFWPDIFGLNASKTYLILFQNNMELRPGGGFIGSYGILTVNKGRIVSFNIYDVYDADGQLKGHVEPPFAIRRYLPSMHWFLRDSNFNVDFSKGAVTSAVFLNTETHQLVDGVVGVDLSFVKNILSILGPVRVNDYNQTVNANNFFQVTQAHAEKDFFPGSTQKKDFLRSFYNSMLLKFSGTKNLPYLSLLQAITKSIYEKHLIFAFSNVNEQAVFSVNDWSSALVDERLSDKSIVNDFIGINEANLGADKVNYYVSRSVDQRVSLSNKGSINEVLTVSFKNSAPLALASAGIYKNYLRFVFPANTTISSIQINGKEQKIIPATTDPTVYEKKGFVAPDGLEVQKEDQGQNTIYGFLVNIQPQELKEIRIEYSLAQTIDISQPEISYSLKIFKQPGVDFYPYNFSFDFPSSFKILNSSDSIQTKGSLASLSTNMTQDREVNIGLAAK